MSDEAAGSAGADRGAAPSRAGPLPGAVVLHATERRVLGVLIEKGLSTPEYYPMTVAALIAGCNQKNNRDPVTNLDEAAVTDSLRSLEQKGLVLSVLAETGRVTRWRQELTRKLELSVAELAVLGELFLRGSQSEGDLRGRASRMRPIETLEALRELLGGLARRTPPMVIRWTAEGVARGVRYGHGFAGAEQLAKWRAEEASAAAAGPATSAAPNTASAATLAPSTPDAIQSLTARLLELEERVRRLEQREA